MIDRCAFQTIEAAMNSCSIFMTALARTHRASHKRSPTMLTRNSITLRIHSPGGSTINSLVIFDLLLDHAATVAAFIDGEAASAAATIAMGAGRIIMPKNSHMLLHFGESVVRGDVRGLKNWLEGAEALEAALVNIYATRSKRPAEEIRKIMARNKYLSATEAHRLGFCDEVTDAAKLRANNWTEDSYDVAIAELRDRARRVNSGDADELSAAAWEAHLARHGIGLRRPGDISGGNLTKLERNETMTDFQTFMKNYMRELYAIAGLTERTGPKPRAPRPLTPVKSAKLWARVICEKNQNVPGGVIAAVPETATPKSKNAWGRIVDETNRSNRFH